MSERNKNETVFRSAELKRDAVNEESRTVEVAFASEMPVERWYGTEILACKTDNVRLGRLNNGGALLLDHERSNQIGVVENARVDADGFCRATVRFSKSPKGEEIYQDVIDGIRSLVSVGYRIHSEEVTKNPQAKDTYRATDWEPYEISIVSIPADETVGVGRNLTENNLQQTNRNMDKPETTPVVETPKQSVSVVSETDARNAASNAITAERKRIADITAIADQSRSRGITVDASKAIAEGKTPDQFREEAFQSFVSRQSDYTPGNATFSKGDHRDMSKFDLGKALRGLIKGTQLDGIERELTDEGAREAERSGIGSGSGLHLPGFFVKRDMTATGETSVAGDQGGMTIATNKAGLLDDFFNASIMRQLGATVLNGLVGNLDVPRLAAGTAAAGKAENASADEVNPTTSQLRLTPKRLPAFIDLSDQLMMQSSSAIESMIRSHLTNQLLAVAEAAYFHGGGTNQANGIAGTSGIGSVAGGANGAAPTYANIVALESAVDATNALGGSLAYASNGQIRGKLKTTPKQGSGVEGNFILSDLTPNTLNGYRALFTNAISRTLTKGNQSLSSAIFFGNFSDYIIGFWGGLNLELIRDSSNAKLGLHTLVANMYYDGGVRRPKSFAAMLDALGA